MIRFSVIIPAYNRSTLLAETLESVFAQRLSDFEVLVVDDGSTDDTVAVVKGYGARVRLLEQPNRGPSAARNLAAAEARGEYLAFLDSDDLWFPWTLETYQRAILEAPRPPAFVTGRPVMFVAQPVTVAADDAPFTVAAFKDYFASSAEWRWYGTSSFVIKADAFRAVGGFAPVRMNGEDADLAMRLGISPGFVAVTSPLTFGYRTHVGSLVSETGRSVDGMLHQLQAEQVGRYPGGRPRARERRRILTRQVRSLTLDCLREGRLLTAWCLYRSTWMWHLALGRLLYLAGFPLLAAAAVAKRGRQAGSDRIRSGPS